MVYAVVASILFGMLRPTDRLCRFYSRRWVTPPQMTFPSSRLPWFLFGATALLEVGGGFAIVTMSRVFLPDDLLVSTLLIPALVLSSSLLSDRSLLPSISFASVSSGLLAAIDLPSFLILTAVYACAYHTTPLTKRPNLCVIQALVALECLYAILSAIVYDRTTAGPLLVVIFAAATRFEVGSDSNRFYDARDEK